MLQEFILFTNYGKKITLEIKKRLNFYGNIYYYPTDKKIFRDDI